MLGQNEEQQSSEALPDLRGFFQPIKAKFLNYNDIQEQINDDNDDCVLLGEGQFKVYLIELPENLYEESEYPIGATENRRSKNGKFKYAAQKISKEFQPELQGHVEMLQLHILEFVNTEKLGDINEVIKLLGYSYLYKEKSQTVGQLVWILPLYECSLDSAIQGEGPYAGKGALTDEEQFKISVQLMRIVQNLQSPIMKTYHNDLKPQNILTQQRVNIIVADLGGSRIVEFYKSGGVTNNPQATRYFSAPEVMQGKMKDNSDVYSVGKIIICLFLGYEAIQDPKYGEEGLNQLIEKYSNSEIGRILKVIREMTEIDWEQRIKIRDAIQKIFQTEEKKQETQNLSKEEYLKKGKKCSETLK